LVGGGVGAGEVGRGLRFGGGIEAGDEVGDDRVEECGLRGSVAGAGGEDEDADRVGGDESEAGVVEACCRGLVGCGAGVGRERDLPRSPCFV
jgi:hypothetical protein